MQFGTSNQLTEVSPTSLMDAVSAFTALSTSRPASVDIQLRMQMRILTLHQNKLVGPLPDSWRHLTNVSRWILFF